MLEYIVWAAEKAGFSRYEISAFAKPGFESVHNTGYWTARPFIGLGPSAFSYLNGSRFRNIAHLKKWHTAITHQKDPSDFEEKLSDIESQNELLAIRLRLLKGLTIDPIPSSLKKLTEEGFLDQNNNHFCLSEKGKLFYDYVASEII